MRNLVYFKTNLQVALYIYQNNISKQENATFLFENTVVLKGRKCTLRVHKGTILISNCIAFWFEFQFTTLRSHYFKKKQKQRINWNLIQCDLFLHVFNIVFFLLLSKVYCVQGRQVIERKKIFYLRIVSLFKTKFTELTLKKYNILILVAFLD